MLAIIVLVMIAVPTIAVGQQAQLAATTKTTSASALASGACNCDIKSDKGILAEYAAPAAALLVGIVNLIWNFFNWITAQRAQKTARKMAALNPYRQEALAQLKKIQSATAELAGMPRGANYNAEFRPVQQRFIVGCRHLNSELQMMSIDPEIPGNNWEDCYGDRYDQYLDCCNTLMNPDVENGEHATACKRLVRIAGEIQSEVLTRFSGAISSA